MAYDDNDKTKQIKEEQTTVRFVVFFIAVVLCVLISSIAHHKYEELRRDCPVYVEDPNGR
jgi:hypothetical protein